jgi:hypothetical protein
MMYYFRDGREATKFDVLFQRLKRGHTALSIVSEMEEKSRSMMYCFRVGRGHNG